mmetsp:Transcript_5978/g.22699  ORF Transcript_5978/g.22699 Transcript_5978/m.22699 type:complete len:80 (-) Transcript_5978:1032-1271(-)
MFEQIRIWNKIPVLIGDEGFRELDHIGTKEYKKLPAVKKVLYFTGPQNGESIVVTLLELDLVMELFLPLRGSLQMALEK